MIQFVLIEVMILFVAFYKTGIVGKRKEVLVGMGISVFVVYVLAHVIDWIQNYLSAKQMTEQLIKLQENVK